MVAIKVINIYTLKKKKKPKLQNTGEEFSFEKHKCVWPYGTLLSKTSRISITLFMVFSIIKNFKILELEYIYH